MHAIDESNNNSLLNSRDLLFGGGTRGVAHSEVKCVKTKANERHKQVRESSRKLKKAEAKLAK